MLNRAQVMRAQRRLSQPQVSPAPLSGWNTRDPFEAMEPTDAIVLDNWYPDFAGLTTRGGTVNFVAGLGSGTVKTLATLRTGTINRFLAACDGKIFDISGAESGGQLLQSGFASDEWQTAQFNSRVIFVNGADAAQIYDGTAMGPTGFTGADMAKMRGVGVFNNRLYFWTGNDPSFWYGPVLGIAGALSNFPLGMVSREGGNLIAVEVLSYDGGTGISDYTCFFMSSGEVLMYQGTDPSNPDNWGLVGRYLIPAPVSIRGITRYGGDVYIITTNDHQQLSKLFIALKLGETAPRTKISGAARNAYLAGAMLPGWQAMYYSAGTRMIYNIPNPSGSFSQHIFNTSTQAWCRFQGMQAYCWGTYNEKLYYGSTGGLVVEADRGPTDNGLPILAQGQQAWQLFGSPMKKRLTMVRPVVQSQGIAQFNFGLGFDYQPAGFTVPDTTLANNVLIWGAKNWGSPTLWGGVGVTDPRWHVAGGEGSAIGFSLAANTAIGATWIRTDLMLEPGSAL